MKCTDNTIKDLLPAYLEQGLDRDEQLRVEGHLATCEDCRTELALLRMVSEEEVPDPGEAFWASMPGRVRRAVQEQQSGKRTFDLARIIDWMVLPRWALAAATIGVVALVSLLLIRPAPQNLVQPTLPENGTTIEDMATAEPLNVAELSTAEFDAAAQWAQNEYAPIQETIGEAASDNLERDISEELSDLSPRELDRVLEMLKKKEQDVRERLRKKSQNDKGLG